MPFGEAYNILIAKPIDIWNPSVTVNAGAWESRVESLLMKIEATAAGKALLDAIKETGWWVKIVPFIDTVKCNAHGHGGATGYLTDSRKPGAQFKGFVTFDPSVYTAGSFCFRMKQGKRHKNGGKPDEVLFHELIHALRGGLGLNEPQPLSGGLFRYGNAEEFFAIVITNVYISDNTNASSTGLRKSHAGNSPLEERLARSLCFFYSSPKVLPMLTRIRVKQPKLFDRLADVDAVFNPFQAMRDVPKAVEAVSRSKRTLNYDRTAEAQQKAELAAYVEELKRAYKDQKLKDQKASEEFLKSIFNASPQEVVQRMGSLGREAFDYVVGR